MTVTLLGTAYPDLRTALQTLARQPAVRVRLTVPGIAGGVYVHGTRLARALRVLPRQWTSTLDVADDSTLRLVLEWSTSERRGRLRLRSLGTISLGPTAAEALTLCGYYPDDRATNRLARAELAAVTRLLGGRIHQ